MRIRMTGLSPTRLLALLALVSMIVASAPIATGSPLRPESPLTTPATSTGSSPPTLPIMMSPPTPSPPVRNPRGGVSLPAAVNPTALYSSEPAPMGIADFGIGYQGAAYAYNTTEFLGNFSWQSLDFQGSQGTAFTVQLNVVLEFSQSGVTYAYWIQDVAIIGVSTSGGLPSLEFENNIWNMSSTSACLSNSAVRGNGTVYSLSGCEGYYAVGASSQPGAFQFVSPPGDFRLLVRSYRSTSGTPEVAFAYWDGATSWTVTYDNVVWPWATHVSSDQDFVVNGNTYNPYGTFYDAELTIGGPGGGSSTSAQDLTHTLCHLLYWNGHNFQAPRSAWNFGSDTAETVSNIQSIWRSDSGGTPVTVQLNGTTLDAGTDHVYDQTSIGFLDLSAPGISAGTVSVGNVDWTFVGGQATFTLDAGTYHVWVNSSAGSNDLGLCTVTKGGTLSATAPGGCSPVTSTPTATPASADLGQSVVFSTSLLSAGSGGDSYSWEVLPALGCGASTSDTLSCLPTLPGSYRVNVTVTDSNGRSATSGNLTYIVHEDPSVTTPTPNHPVGDVGQPITFSTTPSRGSGTYPTYTWTESSSSLGCTLTSAASVTCTPTATGTAYLVSVNVTDSNRFTSPTATSGPYVVDPALVVGAPTASVGSVDYGQPVTFTAHPSGGSGSYSIYTWAGLPTPCSGTGPAVSCTPNNGTGAYSVTYTATDSNSYVSPSSLALSFTVYTDPGEAPPAASHTSVDVGQSVNFSVDVSGGSGGGSYDWSYGTLTGCTPTGSALACAPTAPGTFTVSYAWTDSNGMMAEGTTSLTFTVYADPEAQLAPNSPSILEGQSMTLTATTLAGASPYTYAWSGLPTGCTAPTEATLTCTPSVTGTFVITVTVTDANGVSSSTAATLTVNPSFLGLPADEGYALFGIGIAALAIGMGVVALVITRRRRSRHQPP